MSHARFREYQEGIAGEVSRWQGATLAFEIGGKHAYALISFASQSRKVFFPMTAGDSRRGLLNSLTDVRSVLREIGAERTPEPKAEPGSRRQHHAGPARPIRPGEVAQREDRWFGPLAALKQRMVT